MIKALVKVLVFLARNTARLTLLVGYYLFSALEWASRRLKSLSFHGCIWMGVFKLRVQNQSPEFERKFDDEELEEMAGEVIGTGTTIKEIQDLLGVSYRQARKVKQVADSTIPIDHYQQNKPAG